MEQDVKKAYMIEVRVLDNQKHINDGGQDKRLTLNIVTKTTESCSCIIIVVYKKLIDNKTMIYIPES